MTLPGQGTEPCPVPLLQGVLRVQLRVGPPLQVAGGPVPALPQQGAQARLEMDVAAALDTAGCQGHEEAGARLVLL